MTRRPRGISRPSSHPSPAAHIVVCASLRGAAQGAAQADAASRLRGLRASARSRCARANELCADERVAGRTAWPSLGRTSVHRSHVDGDEIPKLKSAGLRLNLESLSFYPKTVEDGTCRAQAPPADRRTAPSPRPLLPLSKLQPVVTWSRYGRRHACGCRRK